MKKTLEDLKRNTIPEQPIMKPQTDKQMFAKHGMIKSVGRSEAVRFAVLDWLLSFQGGITSKALEAQVIRLDADDNKAIQQLELSRGKRILANPPREKPPKLETEIIDALEKNNSVAVEASRGRKLIESFIKDCTQIGTYTLDINELALEYVDYNHKGRAGEIIHEASRAEVLIILGLEKPISLAYHLRDTIFQIIAVREKDQSKYTLSTWNYTHGWYMPEVEKLLTHYS
jgi:hypothetical protein